MSRSEFKLTWSTIPCSRCQANRVRGVDCPDCGRAPDAWEIDDHLLRRRSLTDGLLQQMDDEPTDPVEQQPLTDADALFTECDMIMAELFAGLQGVSSPEGTGDQLRLAVENFIRLRQTIGRAERRRPYLALGELATALIAEIEQAIRSYLAALRASKPIDAQRHAATAQHHMDRADEASEAFQTYRRDLDSIDNATAGTMLASVVGISMRRGGLSLLELVQDAESRIESLLGVEEAGPVALQFVLAELVAGLELDRDRFTRVFVRAFAAYSQDLGKLARVAASSPELVDDFLDSQVAIFTSCWNAAAIAERAQTVRQSAQALLDLHTVLVEGPGAVVIRTLLLTAGPKQMPYSKLRDGNATEDLRQAHASAPLAPLLEGLDDRLRTAQSHQRVRYNEGSIVATTNKATVEIKYDDLADQVLQGLESVLGCLMALREAFFQSGVEVDDATLAPDLGLPLVDLGALWLQLFTGNLATVEVEDAVLHIETDGALGLRIASLVAGLGPLLDEAKTFEFKNRLNGEERLLTGPTGIFRTPTPDDEFSEHLRVIQIGLDLRLNGEPVTAKAQLRKWCANEALKALVKAGREPKLNKITAQKIRTMMQLADRTGDPKLQGALRRCLRWLGQRDNTDRLLEELGPWATDEISLDLP